MIKFFQKTRQNLLLENKKTTYFKYAIGEIILVVIGILIALQINNWNKNRKNTNIETNLLVEIKNGLEKDLKDVHVNKQGHENGIEACEYWEKLINNQPVNTQEFDQKYHSLLRNFIAIQNKSGYESLKSRGLELISNDILRVKIISLYEEYYEIIQKIDEDYYENQFFEI